jgi:putative acyl-CoA dehydrogenase
MAITRDTAPSAIDTHDVTNQTPPLEGHDVYGGDAALVEAVRRHGAGAAQDRLRALGRLAGSGTARTWGFEANRDLPRLRSHDRYGHRVDEVDFAPAWHELMGTAVQYGLQAAPWTSDEPGAHVARAAGFIVVPGGGRARLPISMTYASVPRCGSTPTWQRPGCRAWPRRRDPAARPAANSASSPAWR